MAWEGARSEPPSPLDSRGARMADSGG
jgi:hypothetical protein